MSALPPDRTPVIVGIGEITDKPGDLALALEPIALMEQALQRAASDATGNGSALLRQLDSLDVVAEYSWPYTDALSLLTARIGHKPRRQFYGTAGGESPVRFIHEAARRIASGESAVCAIVGAEAAHSAAAAAKAGVSLPWEARDAHAKLVRGKDLCHPVAVRHGMMQPVQIYPLYENAATAAWGQTPAQAQQESAELWSRYSAVAADNPYSWLQQRFTPQQIATPAPDNRPIAWPYTKHMVANPFVNQGAAVLVTSLARARELGIAPQRLIYVWSGASANEPTDYLQRDQYQHSSAQDAVLDAVLAQAGGDASRFALVELYSCFPIVPKMARRRLGLPADARMTSTGGLSFFGAPLNNYMTHAAAGLVRQLRTQPGKLALLYGQGEYVTKHHALILSTFAPSQNVLETDPSVQSIANSRRGEVPSLIEDYEGPAAIETFTVVYDRHGAPEFGTVIARTTAGARLMARVRPDDARALARLTAANASPIGAPGHTSRGDDGLLTWNAA
ncbi:acetyl-CoA acetyltransferase [Povalibacter uvarum]|uniref:Acetyl-CoA acetyltransferase n=1 Tax=Povalibacter uvarum TaxID=732238 RepID=A0A841HU74_9GAMM|nr:acetyl-CoA acetyltransferase [Povalibacter uvarum]MBB6095395.1 acetyl-CoA acetyltransferase [Povalibacter uvarum]